MAWLVAADGKPLRRIDDLLRWVRGKQTGEAILLRVLSKSGAEPSERRLILDLAEGPLCARNPKP